MRTTFALIALLLFGCGGSPKNYVLASGAFSSGAIAKASISSVALLLADGPGFGPTPQFATVIGLIDGTPPPDLEWSVPPGVTSSELQIGIAFNDSPSTGTFTDASTNACGGVALTYDVCASVFTYQANTTMQSSTCPQGQPLGPGSWTLTLSSVTQISGTAYYAIHGTFSATLLDASADSGSLELSF
jgi:hypothetical protein